MTICVLQGVCTEAGMYALRERRVHVTQEDFELAVAKVITHLSKHVSRRHNKKVCFGSEFILPYSFTMKKYIFSV